MKARLAATGNLLIGSYIFIGALFTSFAIITGSKILLLPIVLLGLFGWIRFATKHPAAALIIVVFFAEYCFDLTTFGIRQRLLSDIAIALMLPLIILNIKRIWKHLVVDRSPYAIAILLFFCVIVISLYFGSHITFGQPMSVGLTVARKYLLFLSYFFLVAVGAKKKDCFLFLKYLAWLGAVIAFLSIIEAVLGGGVIFREYYAIGQERAGLLRIHVGTFLIVFSILYSFVRFQSLSATSYKKIGYIVMLGLGMSTLLFVVMTRAIFLGLAVTFIFWQIRNITSRKVLFFCLAVSVSVIIVLSGLGERVLTGTFIGKIMGQTKTELGSDKGDITIREKGAMFYLDLARKNTPLTGIGCFSRTNYPNNPVTITADRYHYYPVDINGLATLIYFGVPGAILLSFFVIKSLHDTRKALRQTNSHDAFNFEVLYFIFIYTIFTPTLNNIIVERMLIYSGIFFYTLSLLKHSTQNSQG